MDIPAVPSAQDVQVTLTFADGSKAGKIFPAFVALDGSFVDESNLVSGDGTVSGDVRDFFSIACRQYKPSAPADPGSPWVTQHVILTILFADSSRIEVTYSVPFNPGGGFSDTSRSGPEGTVSGRIRALFTLACQQHGPRPSVSLDDAGF